MQRQQANQTVVFVLVVFVVVVFIGVIDVTRFLPQVDNILWIFVHCKQEQMLFSHIVGRGECMCT